MSIFKFLCVTLLAVVLSEKGLCLDCFVCRGCATVTQNDVQTCSPRVTTTEAPTEEPTTDQDMNFDQPIGDVVSVVDTPYLEEAEPEFNANPSGYVLDKSELPGANFLSRTLKQYRDEEEEARCVIAVFEENGQPNVVRECSYASDNPETRCSEAVGNNFSGNFLYCNLCDSDLCNSASKSAVAFAILFVSVFVNIM